jgi:CrcB protein
MEPVVILLAVGAAGALGAIARYITVERIARRWRGRFPLATFIINMLGAFVLGLLLTVGMGQATSPLRTVIGTGFIGGYTTFSTLSFETHALARRGHTIHAWLNAIGTLAAGLLAVAAGIAVGHMV